MKTLPNHPRPVRTRGRDKVVKPPEPHPSRTGRFGAAIVLLMVLSGFILLQGSLPLSSAIKIGSDEDFALSKALLTLKGYRMYVDYWNDQPPLHTVMLKFIFAHVSFSVLAARLLTVASAIVLLTSLFFVVLRVHGLLAAALMTVLLIGSPGFLELSVSAMVELPGLAPVILALCLLRIAPATRMPLIEIAAGLLYATALQIKLIGAMYSPLIALVLWLRYRQSPMPLRRWIVSGIVFSLAAVAGFFVIQFLTGEALTAQFAQSRASHFSGARSSEHGSPADFPFQWAVLLRNWDTTVPALIGFFLLLKTWVFEKWSLPCAWLLITFAVFTNFRPWWHYYFVHTAIPLCWLAAAAIAAACQRITEMRRKSVCALATVYAVGALAWIGGRLYLQARDIRAKPRTYSTPVLNEIKRYKPFASFIFATEPVYAFHADMAIPPRIATLSLKRFWTGDMTNSRLDEKFRELRPGIVLLSGDNTPPFQNFLTAEYRLVYHDSDHRLYVLPSVVEKADPWPTQ